MEAKVSYHISDELIAGVVTAAIQSEKRYFGLCQDMLSALGRGAEKTKGGTVNAFLFQAMVDRLLKEFHTGGSRT